MNGMIIQYIFIYLLITAFMLARPWLSRRNVLFGVVFGDMSFRENDEIRGVISTFVAASAGIAVLVAGAAFAAGAVLHAQDIARSALVFTAAVFGLIAAEFVPFVLANRKLKEIKESMPRQNLTKGLVSAEIGEENRKDAQPLPARWALLLLAPPAGAAAAAYGMNNLMPGKGNFHALFSLLSGIAVCALLMGFVFLTTRHATASVKGGPSAAPDFPLFRRYLSMLLLAIGFITETEMMISVIGLWGVIRHQQAFQAATSAVSIAFTLLILLVFYRYSRSRQPSGQVLDDDQKWIFGGFYFNPSDPSIFIEKRNGIGMTLNFGRPGGWIVLGGLILVIVAVMVVSH